MHITEATAGPLTGRPPNTRALSTRADRVRA